MKGHIGRKDIDDCMTCLKTLKKSGLLPSSNTPLRQVIVGGSHGGFITGHAIGQFPDVFDCAVARNPVLNLLAEFSSTDIPDWVLAESGLPFNWDESLCQPLKADEAAKLLEVSPVKYVCQVKTPLQIMIGGKDRRVPMDQSIEYFRILKNLNQHVRLLHYPDCQHSLADNVEQSTDAWCNVMAFIHHYVRGNGRRSIQSTS
ncbi:N-acylaminoacyl-peptide hydrolase isoform 4 [Reticulomyxa filosa]|uniref:N-acylaminoacyl-peptide hydrolase isoform 4 n=1 Tax=Reticulomyxa filosa TaxID=46433 RepID=X6NWZ0_RETFI|nr:N-acylaminoacyl-peptide hydrolase isoform 4 [Reticulomyxa filosa]|eukprot:ETO30344.1 N-acylaminoacyl-peptide hydrolase isoform 4 [Reticulomyxa filosa]